MGRKGLRRDKEELKLFPHVKVGSEANQLFLRPFFSEQNNISK
jgi:hypothetical protein